MFSQSEEQRQDYLADFLNGFPDIIDAELLAKICGWKNSRIVHQRKARLPKDEEGRVLPEFQGTLLPYLIQAPGGARYVFTRKAVYDWIKSSGPARTTIKKRGRPKGSKSRRGIGRAELEARP